MAAITEIPATLFFSFTISETDTFSFVFPLIGVYL